VLNILLYVGVQFGINGQKFVWNVYSKDFTVFWNSFSEVSKAYTKDFVVC